MSRSMWMTRFCHSSDSRGSPGFGGGAAARASGYVLLETVVATGLLIVGLAVIGSQVQSADLSVRKMKRKIQAIELVREKLAELELGKYDVAALVQDLEEGDFGPRYPDYGWTLSADETTLEGMFLVRLDVLFRLREGEYKEDEFDYEQAAILHTVYAMRAAPKPISFEEDLGLNEEELADLSDRFDELGIEGLDVRNFDPRLLQTIDLEAALPMLPVVLEALGMDVSQLATLIPPEMLQQLRENGLIGEEGVSGFLDALQQNQDNGTTPGAANGGAGPRSGPARVPRGGGRP